MSIIDISMEIRPGMLVYPDNPKPRIEQYKSVAEADTNESTILVGSHTGTHVDSRLHISGEGGSAADLPLESLYGECVVLDLTGAGREIGPGHLEGQDIPEGIIVLLKTENSLEQYDTFREDYAHLTPDGARHLAARKPRTVGVDYLSVEPFGGGTTVHDILVSGMTVFEGLCLKGVEPGRYIFAGLPLKIACDGSPARAILIDRRGGEHG